MSHSDRVINISRTNIQSYKVVAESICHYMDTKFDGVYFVPAERSKMCILTSDIIGTGSAFIEHRWGDIDAYTEAVKRTLSSFSSVDYTALESRFGGHTIKILDGYL